MQKRKENNSWIISECRSEILVSLSRKRWIEISAMKMFAYSLKQNTEKDKRNFHFQGSLR